MGRKKMSGKLYKKANIMIDMDDYISLDVTVNRKFKDEGAAQEGLGDIFRAQLKSGKLDAQILRAIKNRDSAWNWFLNSWK